MAEVTLPQEKYKALEELVEISTQIAVARETLKKLNEEKDIFFQQREAEVQERITKLLERSKVVLDQIDENYEQLKGYKNDLVSFAGSLKDFFERLVAIKKDFARNAEVMNKDLDARREQVEELIKQNTRERSLIESDRKEIAKDRSRLAEEARAIKDQRETLDRAWSELNSKKK